MMSEKRNQGRFTRNLCRVVLSALAVVVLAGCGQPSDVEQGDVLPASEIESSALPGLAHVHGLGVNPANQDLMIATHFGLWRLRGSEPERVGDSAHDFMGFSVLGPDRFVASGHPQSARDLPPHLGLIESRDAGSTWTSRSLLGSADFHLLRVTDEVTYGWNSSTGKLMSSRDQQTWKHRGELALADLAIDPDDDQHLLASVVQSSSEVDLQASPDGGATWSTVNDGPDLVRLSWGNAGLVWGVATDGRIWRSSDGGENWGTAGSISSAVEAVASSDDTWFAAAGGAIVRSLDRGATWTVLHRYDG